MSQAVGEPAAVTRPALSLREVEVLVEWLRCDSKKVVARRLGISVNTVNTHLEHVRAKYARAGRRATTKAALLARAAQDGLIDLDDL